MSKYLTRLWDDYSKIVLANTRDLDARDPDYDSTVSDKVWKTVTRLREGRQRFRNLIRAELRVMRKHTPE